MLGEDQDALICDMAETYHVLDIWALPVTLLATLASGLRENSRIKSKLAGIHVMPLEMVVPHISDVLTIVYGKKDADLTLFTDLMFEHEEKSNNLRTFDTGEDFLAEWQRLCKKDINNG